MKNANNVKILCRCIDSSNNKCYINNVNSNYSCIGVTRGAIFSIGDAVMSSLQLRYDKQVRWAFLFILYIVIISKLLIKTFIEYSRNLTRFLCLSISTGLPRDQIQSVDGLADSTWHKAVVTLPLPSVASTFHSIIVPTPPGLVILTCAPAKLTEHSCVASTRFPAPSIFQQS